MNEIVKRNDSVLQTMDDVEKAAKAMSASGFFSDAKEASKAIVKIMAGRELGFGAFASMTGVHIIKDKPALGANLIAAAIKGSGKYNYKVIKHNETECHIVFYEMFNGKLEEVGQSRFTIDDAKKAGVYETNQNWKKYPRNQLFARAVSNGQKWFCPDAFNGATVYTPDELGATVDADDNVIAISAISTPVDTGIASEKETLRSAQGDTPATDKPATDTPATDKPLNGTPRPYTPAQLKDKITEYAATYTLKNMPMKGNEAQIIAMNLEECFLGDKEKRKAVQFYLTAHESAKDMSAGEQLALKKWINAQTDSSGAWKMDALAMQEAQAVYRQTMLDQGQVEMALAEAG